MTIDDHRHDGGFRYPRRVQFAETDLAGIVHFSWYFRYMEEAEHALWRKAGMSIVGDGLHWPRVAASCEYKQPLRFEDEIEIVLNATFASRRVEYGFTILRGDMVASTGAMTVVCARADASGALKAIEIPAVVRERLGAALR